jgi:hypothetical protein
MADADTKANQPSPRWYLDILMRRGMATKCAAKIKETEPAKNYLFLMTSLTDRMKSSKVIC